MLETQLANNTSVVLDFWCMTTSYQKPDNATVPFRSLSKSVCFIRCINVVLNLDIFTVDHDPTTQKSKNKHLKYVLECIHTIRVCVCVCVCVYIYTIYFLPILSQYSVRSNGHNSHGIKYSLRT